MACDDRAAEDRPRAAGSGFPKIGDVLIERRLIGPEHLQQALAFQKAERPNRLLGQVLVELRLISEEDLVAALAEASGIRFARISPAIVDPGALKLLPRPFLEKHNVLPLSLSGDQLTVALEDFTNVFLIEDIERRVGHEVSLVAATGENIREVLEAFTEETKFAFDQIMNEMEAEELTLVEERKEEPEDLEVAASNSPVIKLVNHIIQGTVHERASDVHIEPDDGHFRVRYRIDGDLQEKLQPPFGMLSAVVSRIKIMSGMDIAERRIPQDGGLTVILDARPIDLRISTMPTKFGEKVVIRIIDHRAAALDLESLGFAPPMLVDLRNAISEKNGVILVTGPTGSGKSTTLYACLAEIVSGKTNVSTVEDPVEFNLHGVNQFQVNDKAGFTFSLAVRALLRQDPDVIMIGEVRDGETARIAVQAALTGHLVLSTLHTNDAPSAVTRLVNMDVEPYLVAASLRAVLAQRLVRRICRSCTEKVDLAPRTGVVLEQMFGGTVPIDEFYAGRGCARCHDTGYAGRAGIYEMLAAGDAVLEAISRGATLQEIRRLATASGSYTTLREDGIQKVADGVTTVEALLDTVTRTTDRAPQTSSAGNGGVWFAKTRSDD